MKPALALVEPPSCALAARWRRSFSFRLRDSDFRAGPLSPLPSPRGEVRTTNFTLETAAHRVSRAPAHLQSGKRFFPGITQDVRTLPSIRVHIWSSGTLTAPLASNLVSSSESRWLIAVRACCLGGVVAVVWRARASRDPWCVDHGTARCRWLFSRGSAGRRAGAKEDVPRTRR